MLYTIVIAFRDVEFFVNIHKLILFLLLLKQAFLIQAVNNFFSSF